MLFGGDAGDIGFLFRIVVDCSNELGEWGGCDGGRGEVLDVCSDHVEEEFEEME